MTFPTGRSAKGERTHYLDADGRAVCGVTPNGVWLMGDPDTQTPMCASCTARANEGVLTYSSDQVVKMAGCSYRQLDYWERAGHIVGRVYVPMGSGGAGRRWTEREAANVALLAELVRAGLTVAAAVGVLTSYLRDGATVIALSDAITLRIKVKEAS